MSRANKTIANIYNPLNQDKETLLKNFVIRKKEFSKIFRDIKSSKLNQVSQNFLIQGLRGSGKTTLLAKLKYEIENSNDLSHLLAVQFAEEQYNIFSLNRLWENVADALDETKGFENIIDEMEKFEDDDDHYFLLKKYLNKNKKKLILLIDNFGDILDKLGEKAHKKLRDILHESDLQIIAGSTRTLETAYKHDKPFFESFKTIYLESLTQEDVQILLENLNKQYDDVKALDILKNQKGRIETIRRLTGGVPRTIILLYEIIIDDSANVFEDLEGILDKITPLYKHKMDDLATQQQVIIDALALHWDGMLTSEISKQTKLETKKISAQLKILELNGFVFSTFVNKKNKLYMIEERFFNIWYLMRYGRKKKKQQIFWLVSFLKDWCTQEELIAKAKNHITLANSGELNQRGGYYMAEALSQSIKDPDLQYEVLSSTKSYISNSHPEFADSLSDTHRLVFEIAYKAHNENFFKKAEEFYLMAIDNKNTNAMNNLAGLYKDEHKDFKKAEEFYLMAINNKHINAMNNLALLYQTEYKDFKKAEEFYLMAIDNKDAKAMYNLALLYKDEYKDFKKAEKYYLMAINNGHTYGMNNLALLYKDKYKDFKKAEEFYLMAIDNKNVNAMYNLALLYEDEYKDFKKAEKYYLMAIDNKHVKAMFNLALTYEDEYKDFKKAEKYYLMAIDNKHANAMFKLAVLYEDEYKDFKKAEKYYLMAIEDNDKNSIGKLAFLYQYQFKNYKAAENLYLKLIDDKEAYIFYNLALLYEQDLKDLKKAALYYSQAIENDFNNNMDFLINATFVDIEIKTVFFNIFKKYHNKSNYIGVFAQAIFMIHVGEYKASIEYLHQFFSLSKDVNNFQKHIANYFLLLISRKQYHLAMELFQDDRYQLKEKIKPVYYALMNLMKDEYPKEYQRMGAELKETVSEVLESIEAMKQ